MSSRPRLPAKKDVALALLESTTVLIHLDPQIEEVRVPLWFKKHSQLVLEIGLNMPVPIPDLSVDDDSVSCTLSFSRSPFFCFIPWRAVYALVGSDGRSMVWPDDVPPEVVAQAEQAQQKEKQHKTRRAHLRAVPAEGEEPEPEESMTEVSPEAGSPALLEEAVSVGEQVERPAVIEPDVSSRPDAAGKSKRKLPPYLRIVK